LYITLLIKTILNKIIIISVFKILLLLIVNIITKIIIIIILIIIHFRETKILRKILPIYNNNSNKIDNKIVQTSKIKISQVEIMV
jgi:hypothetical protein